MFEPVEIGTSGGKKVYQPKIGQLMGANFFVNGVMTQPWNYEPGADAWLNYAGLVSSYDMRGNQFWNVVPVVGGGVTWLYPARLIGF
ncbi:hypothetical protein ABTJ58_19710, partial [Acinetobacter baumannii]